MSEMPKPEAQARVAEHPAPKLSRAVDTPDWMHKRLVEIARLLKTPGAEVASTPADALAFALRQEGAKDAMDGVLEQARLAAVVERSRNLHSLADRLEAQAAAYRKQAQ